MVTEYLYDLSIECAHVYLGAPFSECQETSIRLAEQIGDRAMGRGDSVFTCMMVDDLHVSMAKSAADACRARVGSQTLPTQGFIFESALVPAALELLRTIPTRLCAKQDFRNEQKSVSFLSSHRGRIALYTETELGIQPSCATLSAAFMLVRLGILNARGSIRPARRTMSVLNAKYQDVERRAHAILEASRFCEYSIRVGHYFYVTANDAAVVREAA